MIVGANAPVAVAIPVVRNMSGNELPFACPSVAALVLFTKVAPIAQKEYPGTVTQIFGPQV